MNIHYIYQEIQFLLIIDKIFIIGITEISLRIDLKKMKSYFFVSKFSFEIVMCFF